MATLGELAQAVAYPFGLVLEDTDLDGLAVNAATFYLGYGRIAALDGPVTYDNPTDDLFNPVDLPYLGPSTAPGVIFAGLDYGPDTRLGGTTPAPTPAPTPTPAPAPLGTDTVITYSEWSVIKPLFMLYVERENARSLEISKQQGIEIYGRTVSEVEGDVRRMEDETLPRAAFFAPVETV